MGLEINIEGKWAGVPPRALSKNYRLGSFDKSEEVVGKFPDGRTQTIKVRDKINAAWKLVLGRASKPGCDCNTYFKGLPSKKSLLEVMNEGKFTFHCLVPSAGKTYDDLPWATSTGRDIGLDPLLFFESDQYFACTLIHELAHVAGATNAKVGDDALQAETALQHCGCKKEFNDKATGMLIQGLVSSRMA